MNKHTSYNAFSTSIALMLMVIPGASRAFYDDMLCSSHFFSSPKELTESQKLAEQTWNNPWWKERDTSKKRAGSSPYERDPQSGRSMLSFVLQMKPLSDLQECIERFDPEKLEPVDIFRDVARKIPYYHPDEMETCENTALHRIAYRVKSDLNTTWIDRLIALGMPVDVRNSNGMTPLQYIVNNSSQKNLHFGLSDELIMRYTHAIERLVFHGAALIDTSCTYKEYIKIKSLFDYIHAVQDQPLSLFEVVARCTVPHIREHSECNILAKQVWDHVTGMPSRHAILLKHKLPCTDPAVVCDIVRCINSAEKLGEYVTCGLDLNAASNSGKSVLSVCLHDNKNMDASMLREFIALGVDPRDGKALLSAVQGNKYVLLGALISLGAHPSLPIDQKNTTCYAWLVQQEERAKKEKYYDFTRAISEALIKAAYHGKPFLNNWDVLDRKYSRLKAQRARYRQERKAAEQKTKEWHEKLHKEFFDQHTQTNNPQEKVWQKLCLVIKEHERARQANPAEKEQAAYDLIEQLQDYRLLYCEYLHVPLIAHAGGVWPAGCLRMLEKIPAADEGLVHCAAAIIRYLPLVKDDDDGAMNKALLSKLIELLPHTWRPGWDFWKQLCRWQRDALPLFCEKYKADMQRLFDDHGYSLVEYCITEHLACKALPVVCQAGADTNTVAINNEYGTPLLHAVMNMCGIKHIKIMLKHGAKPDVCNAWGESARSCAQKMVAYTTCADVQACARAMLQLFDKYTLRFKPAQDCQQPTAAVQTTA